MTDGMKAALATMFQTVADGLESGSFGQSPTIGLTLAGSEHGADELVRGAELAQQKYPDVKVLLIGSGVETTLERVEAQNLEECHTVMERLLAEKRIAGCVTLHYNFPVGVSTVGRVVVPGTGREMLLATTTGTSDTHRVAAMVKNCIYGIAVAKAIGKPSPTVGILNIDGANMVQRTLHKLKKQGYDLHFTESAREDGGVVMRGNDLLQGTPDIMVTDTLTGNLLMKMFSAFHTGGSYEALGYGYGPGVGEGLTQVVSIISRASGAPVIADAIKFTAQAVTGDLISTISAEFASAKQAGLDAVLASLNTPSASAAGEEAAPTAPPAKTVDKEINGIDILEIEDAKNVLWKAGVYAETGMGCTGPVILLAAEDLEDGRKRLKENGYID